MIPEHLMSMANQLVDSRLETTRVYWRKMLGVQDEFLHDPRPLAEIAAAIRQQGEE